MLMLVIASSAMRAHDLGSPGLKDLDEAFHAVVAQNLTHDPFTPTLYRQPWLEADFRDWQANHIWLHKPPLALWLMAGSYQMLGDTPLAARMPSLGLSAAAVALTFFIGRRLLTPVAGIVGAAILAFLPQIVRLVHGQQFSDHVDIALLTTSLAGVFCIVRALDTTRPMRWLALAGVMQGLALLSKSFPGLIVVGVLGVAFAFVARSRWSWRAVGAFFLAALLTVGPWLVWCIVHFPNETKYVLSHQLLHLKRDVESWGAPWDRLLFDYLPLTLGLFWPIASVASIWSIVAGLRERDGRLLVVSFWWWGALTPHLLAASKTPTGTLVGWPALVLLVGWMFARALAGNRVAIGAVLLSMISVTFWSMSMPSRGLGYPPDYQFGDIARANIDVLHQILLCIAGLFVGAFLSDLIRRSTQTDSSISPTTTHRRRHAALNMLLVIVLLVPLGKTIELAWRTTDFRKPAVAFPELRQVASDLPQNAAILITNRSRSQHLIAMFWLRRSVYDVPPDRWSETIVRLHLAGAEPHLLIPSDLADIPTNPNDLPLDLVSEAHIIARADGYILARPKLPHE
jgi:4-amino-4-deoxy-L-arabinose transferase